MQENERVAGAVDINVENRASNTDGRGRSFDAVGVLFLCPGDEAKCALDEVDADRRHACRLADDKLIQLEVSIGPKSQFRLIIKLQLGLRSLARAQVLRAMNPTS